MNGPLTMPKALSKTQKKTDNAIRKVLTEVCDQFLEDVEGFVWLTHQVDYSNFPASLIVTCVFDTHDAVLTIERNKYDEELRKKLQFKLLSIGVKITAPKFQIRWDSEELCEQESAGNWQKRLQARTGLAVARNRPI